MWYLMQHNDYNSEQSLLNTKLSALFVEWPIKRHIWLGMKFADLRDVFSRDGVHNIQGV